MSIKLYKLYFVLFFYCFLILILHYIKKLMEVLLRGGGKELICYSKEVIWGNGMVNDCFFFISTMLFLCLYTYIHEISSGQTCYAISILICICKFIKSIPSWRSSH